MLKWWQKGKEMKLDETWGDFWNVAAEMLLSFYDSKQRQNYLLDSSIYSYIYKLITESKTYSLSLQILIESMTFVLALHWKNKAK